MNLDFESTDASAAARGAVAALPVGFGQPARRRRSYCP